jgi:hypothetical protein
MITVKELITQLLELPMNTKLSRRQELPSSEMNFELEYKMERLQEGVVFDRRSGEYYIE